MNHPPPLGAFIGRKVWIILLNSLSRDAHGSERGSVSQRTNNRGAIDFSNYIPASDPSSSTS